MLISAAHLISYMDESDFESLHTGKCWKLIKDCVSDVHRIVFAGPRELPLSSEPMVPALPGSSLFKLNPAKERGKGTVSHGIHDEKNIYTK